MRSVQQYVARNIVITGVLCIVGGVTEAQVGIPDPSFGTGGMRITDHGDFDEGRGALARPDGAIVVAGYSESGPGGTLMRDIAIARLRPDGLLDTTFGGAGMTVIDVVPGQGDVATAMDLEADGDVLIAGYSTDASDYRDVVLVRLIGDLSAGFIFGSGFETGDLGDWATTFP